MSTRSLRTAAGLAALTVMVALPLPGDAAVAGCTTSVIGFEDGRARPRLAAGEMVTLTASGYVQGCDDAGGDEGFGCAPPAYEQPSHDVDLVLRQQDEEWLLATEDARNEDGELGRISWTVTVPDDVEPGVATLVPSGGEPLRVRVTGG